MKKFFLLTLMAVFSLFAAINLSAQRTVPEQLSFQGNITEQDGKPITAAGKQIVVTIYEDETSTTPLYTETFLDVNVEGGYFQVILGKNNPMILSWDKQYWFEITYDNGTPYPRVPYTTVPYAFSAQNAIVADSALTVADGAITQGKLADGVMALPMGPAGGVLTGTYPNPGIDSQVIVDAIADGSITQDKLAPNVTTTPSGPAGGDLTGTYPNPLIAVSAVKTRHIFDGAVTSPKIENETILAEDIAASAITPSELENTTVTSGTYGGNTNSVSFTVDEDGRLLDAMEVPILINDNDAISDVDIVDGNPSDMLDLQLREDVVGDFELDEVTWSSGTYGAWGNADGTQYSTFTVNEDGRLTAAGVTNVAVDDNAATANTSDINVSGATSNDLDFQLNQDVVTGTELAPEAVTEAHMSILNDPTDNYVIAWNDANSSMTWIENTVYTSGLITGDGTSSANVRIDETQGANDDVIFKSGGAWTTGQVTSAMIADGTIMPADVNVNAANADKALVTNTAGTAVEWGLPAMNSDAVTISGTGQAGSAFQVIDGSIGSTQLTDGGVATIDIATDAVTLAKMDDNSVGSAEVVNNSLTADDIAANAIGNSELGTDAVMLANMADDAVSSAEVVNNSLTADDIAADAIGNSELATDAVMLVNMANDAVGSAEVVNNSLTADDIAANAIENSELATDAVMLVNMDDNSVGTSELINDAVTTVKIIDNAVTTAKILNANVTNDKIADGTIQSGKLNATGGNQGDILIVNAANGFDYTNDPLALGANGYSGAYTGAGDAFTITHTGTGGSVIQIAQAGTSTDPALDVTSNATSGTGTAFKATGNPNDENYVAYVKTTGTTGRAMLIEGNSHSSYAAGVTTDPTDDDEAVLVVRNLADASNSGSPIPGASGKTAIKTYGDIWANSAIGGSSVVALNQIIVGTGANSVTITPPANLGDPLNFSDDVSIEGDLTVTGLVSGNSMSFTSVTFNDLDITDDLSVGDELSVTGNSSLNTLAVGGTSKFTGAMDVTGGIANTGGNVTVEGTTFNGNDVTIPGTLGVTGVTTATGGLDVAAGTFELSAGTTVNEIVTDVTNASTDDQLPTAKAVYDNFTYYATNGLTLGSNTFSLGGTLTQATTIAQGANNFTMTGTGQFDHQSTGNFVVSGGDFYVDKNVTFGTGGTETVVVDGTSAQPIVDITGNVTIDNGSTLKTGILAVNTDATIGNDLDVDGATTLDQLTVDLSAGTATFDGTADVTINAAGNVAAGGDLDVDGATTVDQFTADLSAGTATFDGTADVTINAAGNVAAGGDLDVDGATTLDQLTVDLSAGTTTFDGTADVTIDAAGNLNVGGTATVSSTSDLNGDVSVGANMIFDLAAAQSITHQGGAGGDFTISSDNDVFIEGTEFSGNDVTVAGTTNITGDLDVDGATTLDQLTVDLSAGTTTFDGTADVTINAAGNVTAGGDVAITGALDVDGATTVDQFTADLSGGSALFDGTADVTINAAGNISAGGDLDVDGATTVDQFTADLSGGSALFDGTADVTINAAGNISAGGDLDVDGATTVDQFTADLSGGSALFDGTADVIINAAGNISAGGDLDVDGATTLDQLTVDLSAGTTTFDGTADVTINAAGNVTAGGDVAITGALDVDGATTVDQFTADLSGGSALFDGTADVTINAAGNVAAGGDLDVDGATTVDQFTADLSGGSALFDGTADVTINAAGNISAGGDLDVDGATTVDQFTADLSGGSALFDGTADVTINAAGNISAGGDLDVDGATTLDQLTVDLSAGTTTFDGTADVTINAAGNVTAGGDVAITGALDVDGATTVDQFTADLSGGSALFDGTADVTINAAGNVAAGGDLDVDGATTVDQFTADLSGGSALFDGTADVTINAAGNVAAGGDLDVDGATTVDQFTADLSAGTATFDGTADVTIAASGDVTAGGNVTVTGNLIANGNSTLGSDAGDDITFNGEVQGANFMVLEGATDDGFEATLALMDPTADYTYTMAGASGTFLTTGNFSVENGLTYAGSTLKLGGNLTGATAITNNGNALTIVGSAGTTTFASNGDVAVGGGFDVDGATTVDQFTADLSGGSALFDGTADVTINAAGNISAGGDLDVDGATTVDQFTADLSGGSALFDGTADVTINAAGNVAAGGDLDVDGATTLDQLTVDLSAGTTTFDGVADVTIDDNGDILAGDDVTITDELTVNGAVDFNSSQNLSGNLVLDGAGAQTINHSAGAATGDLTIVSTNNDVKIEGTEFSGNDVTIAADLSVVGHYTSGSGNITLTNGNVTAGGNFVTTNGNFTTTNGNVSAKDGSFTGNISAVNGSFSGNINLTTANGASISHTGGAAGDLTISTGGDMSIQASDHITVTAGTGDNVNIENTVFNDNNVTIAGDLDVDGATTVDQFTADLSGGSTLFDGTADVTINAAGNISAGGDLDVDGATTVDQFTADLSGGSALFDGTVDVTINAAGNIAAGGDLDVDGATTLDQLTVDLSGGSTLFDGTADVTINAAGNVTAGGNVTVTGATDLNSTLATSGDITLDGAASQTITHTGVGATADLTIISTNNEVIIENTEFAGNNVTVPGNVTTNGNSTLGSDAADDITFNGEIQGATPFILEGATDDGNEATIALMDPGADVTYTMAGASGTFLTTGNFTAENGVTYAGSTLKLGGDLTANTTISNGASNSSLTWDGDDGDVVFAANGGVSFGANTTLGSDAADDITFNGEIQGATPFILEGATDDGNEATIALMDPGADVTYTMAGASGTFLSTGNFSVENGVTYAGSTLKLGGNLTGATTIGMNGNALDFDGSNGDLDIASTGNVSLDGTATFGVTGLSTLANVDVNAGNIDGTVIGSASATLGSFTGLTATTIGNSTAGAATFTSLNATGTSTLATVDINAGAIDGTAIGNNAANTGTFTTLNATANSTFDGNTTLGSDAADDITFNGEIQGATPFILEGATDDGNEATIALMDPGADVTYTMAGASGTFLSTGNFSVENGVTYAGSTLKLGGNLTGATTIGMNGNALDFDGSNGDLDIASTGNVSLDGTATFGVTGLSTLANVDVNAGNIDGTVIGSASATVGSFTGLTATTIGNSTAGAATFTSLNATGTSTLATVDINAGAIDGTAIGNNAANTGTFTTLNATANSTFDGNTTLGSDAADDITFNGEIQGATPFILEGATDDGNEATIALMDPGADVTYTMAGASGTFLTTGNFTANNGVTYAGSALKLGGDLTANTTISNGASNSSLTWDGDDGDVVFAANGGVSFGANTTLGSDAADDITFNGEIQGATPLILEGATDDGNEATIALMDPGADVTYTMAGNSGTFLTTGNFSVANGVTYSGGTLKLGGNLTGSTTITNNANDMFIKGSSGATTFEADGDVKIDESLTVGSTNSDQMTINAVIQGATPFVFEGATADAFEATVAIMDPTADVTYTMAGASGTFLSTGNFSASNGVTYASNALKLGGDLTANTTIATSAGDYTLTWDGDDGDVIFAANGNATFQEDVTIGSANTDVLLVESATDFDAAVDFRLNADPTNDYLTIDDDQITHNNDNGTTDLTITSASDAVIIESINIDAGDITSVESMVVGNATNGDNALTVNLTAGAGAGKALNVNSDVPGTMVDLTSTNTSTGVYAINVSTTGDSGLKIETTKNTDAADPVYGIEIVQEASKNWSEHIGVGVSFGKIDGTAAGHNRQGTAFKVTSDIAGGFGAETAAAYSNSFTAFDADAGRFNFSYGETATADISALGMYTVVKVTGGGASAITFPAAASSEAGQFIMVINGSGGALTHGGASIANGDAGSFVSDGTSWYEIKQ